MTAKGSSRRFGLSCALATPFTTDGEVNTELLAAHAKSRLAAGCSSVTLFGTTGEGASLGEPARERTLAALKGHDVLDDSHPAEYLQILEGSRQPQRGA